MNFMIFTLIMFDWRIVWNTWRFKLQIVVKHFPHISENNFYGEITPGECLRGNLSHIFQ